MPINSDAVLYAKVEPVYGVYTAPSPATDAFQVFAYNPVPLESEEVRRRVERGYAGRNRAGRTARRARDPFSIELAGSGAVDTPAHWGTLLRMAMFGAPEITADIEVTYPMVTDGDGASLSLLSYRGKLARMRRRGVRGNLTMDFTERQYPFLACEPIGLLEGTLPVDAGAPAATTFVEYPDPEEVSVDNTAVLLGGLALNLKYIRFNWGMKTAYYSTTGGRAVIFESGDDGDRRSISAEALFEMPDPATKNYFADLDNDVAQTFSLTHGTVPGNIISLGSTRTFVENIELTSEQGKEFLRASLGFVPDAPNNELILKTR